MTIGDLTLFVLAVVGASLVAWVSWRSGYDTAARRAGYTISTLRQSLKHARQETDEANARTALFRREATRRAAQALISDPSWISEQDSA